MPTADRDTATRLERAWAEHAAQVAHSLATIHPGLGSTVSSLADGIVVLQGPGMYVNRALAVGLRGPVEPTTFEALEDLSTTVGVPPAMEVGPFTDATVSAECDRRGYRSGSPTAVMTRLLDEAAIASLPDDPSIVVGPISAGERAVWQQVSEDAWEIGTDAGRRASRAFVDAVDATDGETLVLARDAADGRPLGCATVIIRSGIATMAGMSTLPTERRRGVQTALVRRRMQIGSEHHCELAAVTAVSGGASERNLIRLGFHPAYAKVTHTRAVG